METTADIATGALQKPTWSVFALLLALVASSLFLPAGIAWADEADTPSGAATSSAASSAETAASDASSSDDASSSSSETVPPALSAGQPELSLEFAEGDHATLRATSTITVEGDGPVSARCTSIFVVCNAKGKFIQKALVRSHVDLAPGKTQVVSAALDLTPEERETAVGVRFFGFTFGESGLTRISPPTALYPLDEAKAAYTQAEEERAWQLHVEQWRARFPVDDYSNTLLIGDSIMQNTQRALESALPGVTVDADAGRTLEKGGLVFENASSNAGVLDHVRADGGAYARYVIQTGNNDVNGMPRSAVDEIVQRLGPDKEIYFVTMISTGNSGGTRTTNEAIAGAVDDYPNVHAIDWYGLVADNPSAYLADTCHPRTDRYEDYAAFIKEGLDVVY